MNFFYQSSVKKQLKALLFIAILIALIFALMACKKDESKSASAIVVPHHLLVEHWMEEFYAQVAEDKNDYERIILISPNHLGHGFGNVQTAKIVEGIDVDQESFVQIEKDQAAFLEGDYFDQEHGLHAHYPFIDHYFPEAKTLPIILKPGTEQQALDKLLASLTQLNLENTLIIASIDFSHGVPEEVALKNDERILNWLQEWSKRQKPDVELSSIQTLAQSLNQQEGTVAMDSPETFYIMIKLLESQNHYDHQLWKRGSSASVTGLDFIQDNVSYLFLRF